MSSTGRGVTRKEHDFYASPPWIVHRLLEGVSLPGGKWLEPCAGDGELIRAINSKRSDVQWAVGELRESSRNLLEPLASEALFLGDFLEAPRDAFGAEPIKVAITNPPYSLALPFIKKCMSMAELTVMLLRLNFWGSVERREFLNKYPPDTYVLPNRPVFSVNKHGELGTDSTEYAWFVWESLSYYERVDHPAQIRVLGTTSAEERKAWAQKIKQDYLSQGLIVSSD